MKIFNSIDEISISGESVVTLGKFDGIHRGHQKLIQNVSEKASQGLKSVVFAFDMYSSNILSFEEKCGTFDELGIDYLVNCPFNAQIITMSAEDFVRDIICGMLHARWVVVGCDNRFGYKRRGDVQLLKKMGSELGFNVIAVPHVMLGDERISSTLVRESLSSGNIRKVNQLLGYNYFISGEVIQGRQVGRTIGIPTTNIIPQKDKLLPVNGVYITDTFIDDKTYHGITDIGLKPTFDGQFVCVETFLFDCDEDLYGKIQKVSLLEFVRSEQKFSSVDALKAQLNIDIGTAEEFFGKLQ